MQGMGAFRRFKNELYRTRDWLRRSTPSGSRTIRPSPPCGESSREGVPAPSRGCRGERAAELDGGLPDVTDVRAVMLRSLSRPETLAHE